MRISDKKFASDQVIAIRNPTAYSTEEVNIKNDYYRTLNTELEALASVRMLTSSSAIPGTEIGFTYVNLLKRQVNDPYDPTRYKTLFVDYNYIPFFSLKLLAGRNFDPPAPLSNWINPWEDEDWKTIILNERAIYALGFKSPEEAVDQLVEFENFGDDFEKHRIIGVIEDYHHEAVKREILPMILSPNYGSFQQVYYSVKLNAGADPYDAVTEVEKIWKKTFPDKPFEYFFLNDYYNTQFKSEIYFTRIFSVFSGIAIFIACLGVLGMTLFEANIRLKEISIRKVLGASVLNLVQLLSLDHVRVVLVSTGVAVPIAYLGATQWLRNYPFRITLSWEVFLIPLGVVVLVILLTSCFQILKAASTNPVNHLKDE
jgi:putative ABC transport system permease protein